MPRSRALPSLASVLLLLSVAALSRASEPRWVTGPPYFTAPAGQPVVWYTNSPQYFTDPGDLSVYVNHSAAEALVAAAASVWNVPSSALSVSYGGSLAQHVSSANTYMGVQGLVFPSDVQPGNYAAKQIAVIYDSDGSVTDLLLGTGASDPLECRQNGVTESVDAITPAGTIQHALLVVNGRCTGAAPEQQLQLQYQLERAFGRILGVGWSQTNDNVFTQNVTATTDQKLHWPIMHPMDVVCGPNTYQCLPNPFTLRDDDIAAISSLYPTSSTYQHAGRVFGSIAFETGQGMQGVNTVLQREQNGATEGFQDVSSVTGFGFQQNIGNPIVGAPLGLAGSMGSTDTTLEGRYDFTWVPLSSGPQGTYAMVSAEPVNPLYIRGYSVGPYVTGSVSPSGTIASATSSSAVPPYTSSGTAVEVDLAPVGAASTCDASADGIETAPAAVASTGIWTGLLCGRGHTAWSKIAVQSGRTATIEVTALDESGAATTAKTMPQIGVWTPSAPVSTLPDVTATSAPFNAIALGMTRASFAITQTGTLRFAIADARGDGRPDFNYTARVLYADTVQPAIVNTSGGPITITGVGFLPGNQVKVGGVAATITSLIPTAITATAPPQSLFSTGPVDVTVSDPATGGSTNLQGALSYSSTASPDILSIVSAPSGQVPLGTVAAGAFSVRLLQSDGVTPVAGASVTFSVVAGGAQFGACGRASCVVVTDASGTASTSVTPTAAGVVTLQASAAGAVQKTSFNGVTQSLTAVRPVEYVAAGAVVPWTPQVIVAQNGAPIGGVSVNWTGASGLALSPALSTSNTSGVAQSTASIGPLDSGTHVSGQACAWASVCESITAVAVDRTAYRLVVVSGGGQTASASAASDFVPVVIRVTDAEGDPVAGAAVEVHQTAVAAQMPCPARGGCPVAPVLSSSTSSAVSDSDGLVSIPPMQLSGVAEVTNLAAAAGTQGFVALSVTQTP